MSPNFLRDVFYLLAVLDRISNQTERRFFNLFTGYKGNAGTKY